MSAWDTSNREAMLQALEQVIAQEMPGLNLVRRQALEAECVSGEQMPVVLIDELSSSYSWEQRHTVDELRLESVLVFDLQARCKRTRRDPLGDIAKVRESMVAQLLKVLQNNPTLHTQLEGEANAQDHCVDAFSGAEVRYMKTKFPFARAMVTVRMLTNENFKDVQTFNWNQLVLNAGTGDDALADDLQTTIEVNPNP